MGKSKKRSFNKNINETSTSMKRSDAIQYAVELLKSGNSEAYSVITLFGLSAEEILEGGASYEIVKGMENILK